MDCTDMVIGAARGSKSRILDYFTPSRSTPRRDFIYGGLDTLTAAVGKEEDGVTTLIFRRKLEGMYLYQWRKKRKLNLFINLIKLSSSLLSYLVIYIVHVHLVVL